MSQKRLIIDTDPGIDDSLAILLALASPEIKLEGLTVVSGNTTAQQGVLNALGVLELGGAPEIPVMQGVPVPLLQPLLVATETHGEIGIGYARLPLPQAQPSQLHAVDWIIETILSNPGEISLVAIGPLTNIAMAVRREPRVVKAVREVIIMGGAIRAGGNTTPLAEYNVFCDPHATHIVFHSGMPITLVPLDVTYQAILTQADVQRLLELPSPITSFVAESTRFYMEFHDQYQKIQGCVINDPLALALTFAPHLVDTYPLFVDVDISGGVSMGKTFADFYSMQNKSPNMQVALEVRPSEFIELFLERLQTLAQSLRQQEVKHR